MSPDSEGPWLQRLLDIGYTLTTELDQRVVLDRVLENPELHFFWDWDGAFRAGRGRARKERAVAELS